jgi:hypothetical protein
LALRSTQSPNCRTEDKLYCCSTLSNSRIFVCLSHLVAEVGAFIVIYILYVYNLCYCWLKADVRIDDRVFRLKIKRVR